MFKNSLCFPLKQTKKDKKKISIPPQESLLPHFIQTAPSL